MQAGPQLVGRVRPCGPAPAGDDDPGGGHPGEAGQPDDLPGDAHRFRTLPAVTTAHRSALTLAEAVTTASTGDVWLFRGRTMADRAIRAVTNSPVNHVGMVVALDDLPPLLWHAELGRSLPDVWTGEHQRGVQLHLLADAVTTWREKYRQHAWVRLLDGPIERHQEDRLMEVIDRYDGRPFPSWASVGRRWIAGRVRRGRRTVARDGVLRRARGHDVPGDGHPARQAPGELLRPGHVLERRPDRADRAVRAGRRDPGHALIPS